MSKSSEAAYEMSSAATSGNPLPFLVLSLSGERGEKNRGGGYLPIEGDFTTQAFSWVLGLLIKEIISQ